MTELNNKLKDNSKTIQVLDHGFVTLVDHLGDDDRICNAARVSLAAGESFNDETPRTKKDNKRLINYLLSHGHTSPFEQVEFVFLVQAPIFVIRQWHRHRTWSYNEISGRYTELPAKQMYMPERSHIHHKSASIKQGRGTECSDTIKDLYTANVQRIYRTAGATYEIFTGEHVEGNEDAISVTSNPDGLDISREIARIVLPVSTYSRMYAKVDLSNLLKFIGLRAKPNAQYEIQVYAKAMLELIKPIVPLAVGAWEKHVFNAVKFNSAQRKSLETILGTLVEAHELSGLEQKEVLDKLWESHGKRIQEYLSKVQT